MIAIKQAFLTNDIRDYNIYPYLGEILLTDITPTIIKKRILDYRASGKAIASCTKLYNVLNGVLQNAYDDELIPVNPMTHHTLKKKKILATSKDDTKEETIKALSIEELNHVLSCAEKEPLKWRAYIALAADSWCRRGELCALRWSDIDWDNQLITIKNNVQYTSTKGVYETSTKNRRIRRVDIGEDTIDILKQWKAEQAKECVCKYVFNPEKSNQYKHAEKDEDQQQKQKKDKKRVIPIEISPMHPQTPTRYFKKFGDRYGVADFHPHLLRHTGITHAILNGADVVSVSQRAGHSDSAITARTYTHPNDDSIRRAGQIARDARNAEMTKAK